MFDYEEMFLEDAELETKVPEDAVEENCIDPDDESSILEAMADIDMMEEACKKEACKKEACKKEGKEVCEKCGKPKKECTCK